MGNLSDFFAHLFVEHGINLIRASSGIDKAAQDKLQSLVDDLVMMLNAIDMPNAKKSIINSLIREAYDTIDEHYTTLGTQVLDHLSQIAEIEGKFVEKTMNKGIGAKLIKAPADLADGARKTLVQGAPTADWIKRQSADAQFKFRAAISAGYQEGQTTQQIVAKVAGSDGFMQIAKRNATTLVHTAVQETAAEARMRMYKENSDVVMGMQQISTLDSHTTPTCIAYSGACWDLDQNPIRGNDLPYNGGVPRHWGCRSTEIPLTKSWKDLGVDIDEIPPSTRASMDGQVSAAMTFTDWLDGKSQAFQDKLLGPGRAQLYRDGKITLRDLVNNRGATMSLAELRAKYE